MPLISLTADDATVDVAPAIGGAIAAFRHGGRDVLRPTPPAALAAGEVRQLACYPLVPYSNRIAHATLRAGDRTFALARNFGDHPHAIHGLGWQRAWRAEFIDDRHALLELEHVPAGDAAAAWPFAFVARQAFALRHDGDAAALTLTLSIENRDARAFPFGLGWHPFFPRNAATELRFDAGSFWETEATRLPTARLDIPAASRFDAARVIGDTRLDNVFAGWRGDAEVRWPDQRRRATIEADRGMTFLVVFIPDDRDYLAIEPVTHMTDGFNRFALGERETGTMVLAPAQSRSCTMRIVSAPIR